MHKITILWGSEPHDGQEAITYSFNTKAELDAFEYGMTEMEGWLGYDADVPEGYVYREEEDA